MISGRLPSLWLFTQVHLPVCASPSRRPAVSQQPGSQQAEHAMSTLVNSSSEIPWWKEPTKDQWIAWIAAWLGWTLDAFDFTIFLLIMVPIAESFNVPLIEVTACVHSNPLAAAGGCHRLRMARRSHRTQDAVDDFDPVVLDLQLRRRSVADLRTALPVPRASRHWHGCGVARRRCARHGVMADPFARAYERRAAGLVEHRILAVQPRVRNASAGVAC
jgi:hypothetical protein